MLASARTMICRLPTWMLSFYWPKWTRLLPADAQLDTVMAPNKSKNSTIPKRFIFLIKRHDDGARKFGCNFLLMRLLCSGWLGRNSLGKRSISLWNSISIQHTFYRWPKPTTCEHSFSFLFFLLLPFFFSSGAVVWCWILMNSWFRLICDFILFLLGIIVSFVRVNMCGGHLCALHSYESTEKLAPFCWRSLGPHNTHAQINH